MANSSITWEPSRWPCYLRRGGRRYFLGVMHGLFSFSLRGMVSNTTLIMSFQDNYPFHGANLSADILAAAGRIRLRSTAERTKTANRSFDC